MNKKKTNLVMLLSGSGCSIENAIINKRHQYNKRTGVLLSYYDLKKGSTAMKRMKKVLGTGKKCNSSAKKS